MPLGTSAPLMPHPPTQCPTSGPRDLPSATPTLRPPGVGLCVCFLPPSAAGLGLLWIQVGLGLAFLRHVVRCRVLLHVVAADSKDPIGDFEAINNELKLFNEALAQKPQVKGGRASRLGMAGMAGMAGI